MKILGLSIMAGLFTPSLAYKTHSEDSIATSQVRASITSPCLTTWGEKDSNCVRCTVKVDSCTKCSPGYALVPNNTSYNQLVGKCIKCPSGCADPCGPDIAGSDPLVCKECKAGTVPVLAISWQQGPWHTRPFGNWEDGYPGAPREYCLDCKTSGCGEGGCHPVGYNKTWVPWVSHECEEGDLACVGRWFTGGCTECKDGLDPIPLFLDRDKGNEIPVCRIPAPNKCQNCHCLSDPDDPNRQICSPAVGCPWGYRLDADNPAKCVKCSVAGCKWCDSPFRPCETCMDGRTMEHFSNGSVKCVPICNGTTICNVEELPCPRGYHQFPAKDCPVASYSYDSDCEMGADVKCAYVPVAGDVVGPGPGICRKDGTCKVPNCLQCIGGLSTCTLCNTGYYTLAPKFDSCARCDAKIPRCTLCWDDGEGPYCRDCAAGYSLARNGTCVESKPAMAKCKAAGCGSCPENKGCARRLDRKTNKCLCVHKRTEHCDYYGGTVTAPARECMCCTRGYERGPDGLCKKHVECPLGQFLNSVTCECVNF